MGIYFLISNYQPMSKVFKKLRIIEVGATTNFVEQDGKRYNIVIGAECFDSLCAVGNEKPVHARKTHGGYDLLDGYLGSFTNFSHDGKAVYADLHMSEALEKGYANEYTFMCAMIEKEPDMLGVSVNQKDTKKFDEENLTATVTTVEQLYSADLVGLPAATSSLFNNNFKNSNEMSKLSFKGLFSLLSQTKLAEEKFTTVDGHEITVVSEGEEVKVGDAVNDVDGNPVGDGDYHIKTPEGDIILVVAGGVISEVKEVDVEKKEGTDELEENKEEDKEKKTPTPEEYAAQQKELTQLKADLAALKTQLNKQTKTPVTGGRGVETKTETKTTLSAEAVAAKAKELRDKMARRY